MSSSTSHCEKQGHDKRVRLEEVHTSQYYALGFLLYTTSSLAANPFLLVKRRLQLGDSRGVYQTWKDRGVASLFRGGTLCWISGTNRMAYFTVYEMATDTIATIRSKMGTVSNENSTIFNLLCSASSGVAAGVASITSQLVLTPLSVVSTRIHVHDGPPLSAWTVASSVMREHGGCGALWTGYSSALLQSVPHNLVMFTVYNFSKAYIRSLGIIETSNQDMLSRFFSSIVGSYAAIVATSPIDIARTHRQALISANSSNLPSQLTERSMSKGIPSSWEVLKDIKRNYGLRFLYRGSTARLLSSTPYTVAMLIGYDYVKLLSLKTRDRDSISNNGLFLEDTN